MTWKISKPPLSPLHLFSQNKKRQRLNETRKAILLHRRSEEIGFGNEEVSTESKKELLNGTLKFQGSLPQCTCPRRDCGSSGSWQESRAARATHVRGAVQLEVPRGKSQESISQSPAQAARPARVPKPRRHADSHLYGISGGCCQTGSGWLFWAPKGGCHIPTCAPQRLPLPRAGRRC